jgi:hypothetical protein
MSVPAKHGFWLDQKDGALPMANKTCQEDHEPALVRLEAWARNRSRGDHELLVKECVFREQLIA